MQVCFCYLLFLLIFTLVAFLVLATILGDKNALNDTQKQNSPIIHFFLEEREIKHKWGQRERESLKQAPHSMQSPTGGLIP